jgi:hypothetical protein
VSHTKEEHALRVLENKVLRRIFGSYREEIKGGWTTFHKRSFIICTLYQYYLLFIIIYSSFAPHGA